MVRQNISIVHTFFVNSVVRAAYLYIFLWTALRVLVCLRCTEKQIIARARRGVSTKFWPNAGTMRRHCWRFGEPGFREVLGAPGIDAQCCTRCTCCGKLLFRDRPWRQTSFNTLFNPLSSFQIALELQGLLPSLHRALEVLMLPCDGGGGFHASDHATGRVHSFQILPVLPGEATANQPSFLAHAIIFCLSLRKLIRNSGRSSSDALSSPRGS